LQAKMSVSPHSRFALEPTDLSAGNCLNFE
jgi:hypothetical protein